MPCSAASDLGLHSLPMSHKKDARLIWVNTGGLIFIAILPIQYREPMQVLHAQLNNFQAQYMHQKHALASIILVSELFSKQLFILI